MTVGTSSRLEFSPPMAAFQRADPIAAPASVKITGRFG
jgi:hypothetical protein